MDIYNSRSDTVQFCIYEPGDRLYWFSLYPGGAARATLAPGAKFTWTGAGTRPSVQVVFFVNGAKVGPRLVPCTAITIDQGGNILNGAPRQPSVKDAIHHVVVLMLENRSFDNVLGWLYADSSNRPPRNIPASANPTFDGLVNGEYWNTIPASSHDAPGAGRVVATRGVTNTPWYQQPNPNPREDYPSFLEQMFGTEGPGPGARANMSGFLANYAKADPANPQRIMQSYSPEQLPVLSQLAKAYAVCDRWFSPIPCETWPNRSFLHAGTSFGRLNNGDKLYEDADPVPNLTFYGGRRTVFDALDAHQVSWKVYHDTIAGPSLTSTQFWTVWQKLTHAAAPLTEFERAAKAGTLPAYSFIEPEFMLGANDQHPGPGCDMRRGEDLILRVWNAVSQGLKWNNTLLVITYDEHGGCYDHVPPPATAVPPDNSAPQFDMPGFSPFRQFGPRVPAVVISPLIEPGTVFRAPRGGTEYDHTSILATIRDWVFRPENGYPGVPGDWLPSARIAAAPTLWPVLTRTAPRTDKPAIQRSAPRALDTPSVIEQPLLQENSLQVALAVEADALLHAGLATRPAAAGAIDADAWKQLTDVAIARHVQPG